LTINQNIILRIIWRKKEEKEEIIIIKKKRNKIEPEKEIIIEIKSGKNRQYDGYKKENERN
jgi:hypothetical protein